MVVHQRVVKIMGLGTDSCNKLTVFDWLSNMSLPTGQAPFDCVEVRFKNGRKEFYQY
jgi:hypothetical protein